MGEGAVAGSDLVRCAARARETLALAIGRRPVGGIHGSRLAEIGAQRRRGILAPNFRTL